MVAGMGWLVICAVLAGAGRASADTYVNRVGPNNSVQQVTLQNTTWSVADSPYIIESHVTVDNNATLTVEPGVVVKFNNGVGLYVNGSITANNTTFTANADGNWLGIYLASSSANNLLEGCTFERAGENNLGYIHSAYRRAALYTDDAKATVRNCLFQNNVGHGIEIWSGQVTIQNNTFKNHIEWGYPVVLDHINTFPVLSGNSFTGTGIPGIYLPGGTITGTNRWTKAGADFPYFLDGGVTLASDAQLTVDPGVVLKTENGWFSISGKLLVQGTVTEPVTFTTRSATPAPGQWYGLYFAPEAGSSVLNYLTVAYAGRNNIGYIHSGYRLVGVYVDGCSPTFNNLQVLYSGLNGVEMWACNSVFNNLTIKGCEGFALRAETGSRPVIKTATFQDNGNNDSGYHMVGMDATSVPDPSGITCINNRYQAVRVWGGTITSNSLWKKWGDTIPYYITDNVSVQVDATLTVEQGATVKLRDRGLYVYGTLKAEGNPGQIRFTSWRDDSLCGDSNGDGSATQASRGDWTGIYLAPEAGNTVLDNCVLNYAGQNNLGYYNSGYRLSTIYVDKCSPVIKRSTFSHNVCPIELHSSSAIIQNNIFEDTQSDSFPVRCNTMNCQLNISGNSADGSGYPGVYLPGGTVEKSATWMKPGTNFPYYVWGNLTVAEGVALTLESGNTFKNWGNGWYIFGTLQVNGLETDPVKFTSRAAEPAPGQWLGLYFGGTAGASIMNHAIVEYAGQNNIGYWHSGYRLVSLYLDGCNPVFNHLTVSKSGAVGIEMWNARPSFADLVVDGCGSHALLAYASSRPQVVNAVFSNNTGAYAIACEADSVPNPANTVFATNSNSGIQVYGGEVVASTLWRNFGTNAPYVITSDVTIRKGTELTIQTGAIVKVLKSALYVNGNLYATNVTFTSANDDAFGGDSNGDITNSVAAPLQWKGIYISPDSGASVLERCRVAYSGQNNMGYIHSGYRQCAVYVDGSSPRITECVFAEMGGHGVELYDSQALLRGNQFVNVPKDWFAVVFDNLSRFANMSGNSATGAGYLGAFVPGGSIANASEWTKAGTNFPYIVWDNLSIDGPGSLSLAPGVAIKPRTGGIYVNSTLHANGSPSDHVFFSNLGDQPVAETWTGIYFAPTSVNSTMNFCDISGAGRNNLGYFNSEYQVCAIYVDKTSPQFRNLKVSANGGYGVRTYGSAALMCNSLFYSNAWGHVRLDGGTTASILNNTLVAAGDMGVYVNGSNPLVANNIIAFNAGLGFYVPAGTPVEHHNVVYGNTKGAFGGREGFSISSADLQVDPLLVDRSAGNYRLMDGSPAINAGDNSQVSSAWTDLDGRLRIHATTVDIGAYESGSAQAVRAVDGLVRNAGDAVYIGENLYDLAGQTVKQSVFFETPAVFNLKLKYSGNLPDGLVLRANPAVQGWTVKVFDALSGGSDVTEQVLGQGGLTLANATTLSADLRVEITPGRTLAGNASQTVEFNVYASGDPVKRDSLAVVTVNKPYYQPDVALRRASDVGYAGENLVNNTGAGQQKTLEVESAEKAVFFYKIANLGNLPDSFVVRGPAGGAGWDVRYFDAAFGTNDITASVISAGWTNVPVAGGNALELRLEIVGATNLASGAVKDILLVASSFNDNSKLDAARATVKLTPSTAVPQVGTYTLDSDFEKGTLVGVEYLTVPNQLQLSQESITLPFIWVPNSNEGTVSKVDTRTGRELGRYRTGPADLYENPSRTTVDLKGNCWVANRRTGTAVKIGLYENGQYVDRNGNGIIETSQDLDGDGNITGSEILPWGQDECVLQEVVLIPGKEANYVPGTYTGGYSNDDYGPGVRGVAIDAKGNVWLSPYTSMKFYYVNGETGEILRTVDVSSVNHTCYGALIDGNGILWSSGQNKRHVLRLDTSDDSFKVIDMGHYVYGLGLDRSNHVYVTGWQDSKLSRINALTGIKEWTVQGGYESRGVAVTEDGDVWVANSGPGTVGRWSADGILKATISVGNQPTGVAVDAQGFVWAVNVGDEYIERINPANNTVDLSKRIVGANHYGYSDMTGIISRNSTTKYGRWTVVHNGGVKDTPWGTLAWHSKESTGATLSVQARSSNDRLNWSMWEKAVNGIPLHATPPGKYLEVEVVFQVTMGDVSPVLYDLTVTPSGQASGGQQVAWQDFKNPVSTHDWSQTNITVSPQGQRSFLGAFDNTNVAFTVSNLPPHAAVIVNFDLLVIGSWDGNSTTDGPDLFEVNVAGGRKLVHATFNNAPQNSLQDGQSYPDVYEGAIHPARYGASETNTLGFGLDTVYKQSCTFTHSSDTLVLNFLGSGLGDQETWGVDNVEVRIIPLAAPPYLKALGKPQNGVFRLQLAGETGASYTVEASTNFVNWTTVAITNLAQTNVVECMDANGGLSRRFYRARQNP